MTWSSISAGFGNIGQTNYSYGNSYIDSLIENRIKLGFNGISVQWGIIGDVGFVSRNGHVNSLSSVTSQPIMSCLKSIDFLLANNMMGVFTNYMYEKKNNIESLEEVSLINMTCNLLQVEYSDKIKNIPLNELGLDSLLSTNLQNMFNKKGIKFTLDEITQLTFEKILLISP